MKIVIINGSARKGNTLTAINAFIKGASEKNEIEIIEPDKLNIEPCKGCGVCQCSKGCVDKDDTNPTIDKIAAADMILFATPVYWWGMSAQLKLIIDKCYCRGLQLKNKKVGTIVVGGSPVDSIQYELIDKQFDCMAKYLSWDMLFNKSYYATARDELEKNKDSMNELEWIGKNVSDLTLEDAESFLTAKRLEGRSPETHNHYRSAIKFLYKKVLKILWDDDTVPAMKRERNLPAVLSRDEINAIIDATPNLKHKAIIATMYSSGLRVSEVVHLHYDDISRTNMTIHVRETKGRIDRYTILSQKNLDLLTEYWYKCGRPKDILFPSSWSGGYLDIASVNQFFKKSAKLAGINRHVSSHACRHSFASHLFESGTDIKYIQSLLGHVDPRSTDVYLHVSNKTLLGIRSPFDNPEGGES